MASQNIELNCDTVDLISSTMGESFSRAVQPEELAVFKKLPTNTLLDNIEIPERPENRRPTDRKFLIVFAVAVVILFPFLIYTMVYSDFGRYKGYDQCGNVCGQKNKKYDKWDCTGEDNTNKPYLQYETSDRHLGWDSLLLTNRKCVQTCESGYVQVINTCYKKLPRYNSFNSRFTRDAEEIETLEDMGKGLSDYLNKNAWRIALACFLSLGVGMLMLFLFKTATAAVVWGILGGVLIFGTILVGLAWYAYFNFDKLVQQNNSNVKSSKEGILFLAIFFTILILIFLLVAVFMYRKIQLVIQLLKEATKAAFAMPQLLFIPIITFVVELIILGLLAFTTAFMITSGVLSELTPSFLYYKENIVMQIAMIFNVIIAFWSTQFIIGVQYMVIAGAVAKWYWSKNKNNLDSPICSSAGFVFKYHLGSVAFGSLIITIIAIIRALLTSLTKNKAVKAIVDACIGALEDFLKFLSKNAYILIAMHGKPFYKSGKRAAKIIFQNAVNIVSINFVGDFVLGMAQMLIVLISLLITVGLMHGTEGDYQSVVYLIVFFVSLFVAVTCFSIFETTIDTIFLCFCEDSLLNDGMARPYAMSRDLMEFVENSKKLYGEKKD
ncbi:choline transporter-like protein 1 isoform X2 [Diabrotica undecimpunctata]|uniref:choline transporter-like protein 1 isoform X2 n=1 Tax=Diabrotica undecimpunctata TaxID=50387 RepID=UPI003B640AAE